MRRAGEGHDAARSPRVTCSAVERIERPRDLPLPHGKRSAHPLAGASVVQTPPLVLPPALGRTGPRQGRRGDRRRRRSGQARRARRRGRAYAPGALVPTIQPVGSEDGQRFLARGVYAYDSAPGAGAEREKGRTGKVNQLHVIAPYWSGTTWVCSRMSAGTARGACTRRCGVSQPAIARLELGEHEPRLATLRRVAQALHAELVLDFAFRTGKRRRHLATP